MNGPTVGSAGETRVGSEALIQPSPETLLENVSHATPGPRASRSGSVARDPAGVTHQRRADDAEKTGP